jgi:hypothetical protein
MILYFDVAMQNVIGVQIDQATADLLDCWPDDLFLELCLCIDALLDEATEISLFCKF